MDILKPDPEIYALSKRTKFIRIFTKLLPSIRHRTSSSSPMFRRSDSSSSSFSSFYSDSHVERLFLPWRTADYVEISPPKDGLTLAMGDFNATIGKPLVDPLEKLVMTELVVHIQQPSEDNYENHNVIDVVKIDLEAVEEVECPDMVNMYSTVSTTSTMKREDEQEKELIKEQNIEQLPLPLTLPANPSPEQLEAFEESYNPGYRQWKKNREEWTSGPAPEVKPSSIQGIPEHAYSQVYQVLVKQNRPLKEPMNLADALKVIRAGWVADGSWPREG